MKSRLFLTFVLAGLMIFVAACGSGQNQPQITATQPPIRNEAPTKIPQMIATSRGPNLEATDPATVRLDSGGVQLVEFFRFT